MSESLNGRMFKRTEGCESIDDGALVRAKTRLLVTFIYVEEIPICGPWK